jgi:hypothetical protein
MLPGPLQSLLGIDVAADAGHQLPPMKLPPHPADRQASWIWVPTEQCTANSLVLALLRDASGPLQVQKLADDVQRLKGVPVNSGSVANVLTRLKSTKVARGDAGWTLIDKTGTPVLHQGHLWGAVDVFEKQEVAAHRRMAILHVLGQFPGGLQIVQIVEMLLDKSPWFNRDIPCNKDLVKDDLAELDEQQKAKRQGNSKKWVLA